MDFYPLYLPNLDGGSDPAWDYEVNVDVVDQYLVDLEVYHQSNKGSDVLLGYAQMSLLSVYRSGRANMWCVLKQKKLNGGIKEIGTLNMSSVFWAGPQLAYPLYRPNVDRCVGHLKLLVYVYV